MRIRTDRLGRWMIAAVIGAAACQDPPTASHDLSEADLAAVRTAWDAIDAANKAGDWDALQQHSTSDFVHLDPRVEPIYGIEAWREWVESMEFTEFEGGFTVEEVSGSGDLAYVMWTFESSWMEAGVRVEAEGKGLSLFRREEDGSWRTSRNAWNLNP